MRIFPMVNNWLGWQCLRFLDDTDREVVGIAIHPEAKRRFGEEILDTVELPPERIFDGSSFSRPEVIERIEELAPEIGVSILFDYIFRRDFIDIFPKGIVNLHPSLLPYNRGQYPNVWSIVEGTPSGVTLHYVDEGVDTGDIIAQEVVPVLATDTGETLYRRLERAGLDLFVEAWPSVESGNPPTRPQPADTGTSHRRADVAEIDEIDLDATYRARHLLNILRARTFPPHGGAYFVHQGRRIHVRVQLVPEEELETSEDVRPAGGESTI